MRTKMDFLDLPAEIRNHIYKEYTIITAHENRNQRTHIEDLRKVANKTVFDITLALQLPRHFSILLANKQVMHEAFASCLAACNFRLPRLDTMATLVKLYSSLRLGFGPLAMHPRTVHITFTKKEDESLVPCTLGMLRHLCPRLERLRIFLSRSLISLHVVVKQWLARAEWPSLRKVEIRRPDLTLGLAEVERKYYAQYPHMRGIRVKNPQTLEPWNLPFRIPWSLEMGFLFLRKVNKDIDGVIRLRRGERLEDKGSSDRVVRCRGLDLGM